MACADNVRCSQSLSRTGCHFTPDSFRFLDAFAYLCTPINHSKTMSMRKLFIALSFCLAIPTLFSCGGDDGDDAIDTEQAEIELYKQKIIGSWERYEQNKGNSTTEFQESTAKDTLTFYSDGTRYSTILQSRVTWEMWYRQIFIGSFIYSLSFDEGYSIMQLRQNLGSDIFIYRYRRIPNQ